MPQSKSTSVVTVRLGSATRWLLLLPALLAILGAWFAVHWYVGNTLAEYAPGITEGGLEMARMAVRWAPEDPLTHWRLGTLAEKNFSADNIAAAVREYQEAVARSPNDYRYWSELGHALEAAGDGAGGEKALRRAVDLAPAYSHPRWYLGNLLLREGKIEAAFDQLGRAAEADALMRSPVFGLAMQVFDGDIDQITKITHASPEVRLQFAIYLVTLQRFGDALRMWTTLSQADRQAQSALSKEFEKSLLEAQQFRAVLAVRREIEASANLPAPEQVWNGGFESPLTQSSADTFGWVVNSRPAAQIGIDTHAHSGQGGLRIVFKSPSGLNNIEVSQTIAVEPGTQYRFEYYARTEGLVSVRTPFLRIVDAVDGLELAASKPLPSGTNDWQRFTFDFTMNPKHDAITIKLIRPSCGDAEVCPIFGSVWYDDFNLQRIGGPGTPRRDAGGPRR